MAKAATTKKPAKAAVKKTPARKRRQTVKKPAPVAAEYEVRLKKTKEVVMPDPRWQWDEIEFAVLWTGGAMLAGFILGALLT